MWVKIIPGSNSTRAEKLGQTVNNVLYNINTTMRQMFSVSFWLILIHSISPFFDK